MADQGGCGCGVLGSHSSRGSRPAGGLSASPLCLPRAPNATLSLSREHDEHAREVDMPRRGITVAVIVILACLIVLGLASSFLVDWAWFSAIGYLNVFWTILGGKAALFFTVFAGSAVLLWVNGSLAYRFARRRGHVR